MLQLKPIIISLIIAVAMLAAGCTSPEHKILTRADAVIIDYPDSAMAMLRTIDRSALSSNDLPYYALLFTQAQIETGIEVKSDSLIKIAYEKYGDDTRGDKGIRSNFYLGEVYYLQAQNLSILLYMRDREESELGGAKSLKPFLRAYEEAKRLNNDYWHARAAKRVKIHFCMVENFYEGERYAREVVEYFRRAGRDKDLRMAIIDHAQLYNPLRKYSKERAVLDSLRSVLLSESPVDSVLLSRIDFEFDEIARAKEKLKKDGILLFEDTVRVRVDDEVLTITEATEMRDLTEEITEARKEYYDNIARKNAENARFFQKMLWIAIIVFITIATLSLIIIYMGAKARKERTSANLESFLSLKASSERMTEEIKENEDTISHLKQELEANRGRERSYNEIVRSLLAQKWSTLVMLCDELYDLGQSDADRKRVVRNIEKELKKIASPQSVSETVEQVDAHMDGIITRLRQQCPFLKEPDINFLGLIFAGFSVRAVCMFTGIEYQHFYVKKSRLLKRIQNSDAPDRELFASLMQKKN